MAWLKRLFGEKPRAASGKTFAIWIVTPPDYHHSRCFEEVALALQSGFRALGHDASISTAPPPYGLPTIVLGSNLLDRIDPASYRGKDLTLFNLEQIYVGSPWLTTSYVDLLRQYPVWDYSDRNIAELRRLDIQNVAKCGIGYAPELSRIEPQEEDIDVLFVGIRSDRRAAIVEDLARNGVNVTVASDCYGEERDALVARSKVILNVHYYDARVFEIVRVSYMLANRKCVVSETGLDPALEAPFASGVVFAPFERVVASCLGVLQDSDWRERVAQRGFELFRAMPQSAMIASALASTARGP
ncbi:MAG: hypothetical protein ACM30H_02750 [Clostridia bacterium]